ncbi:cyclic nucleotide-binding domain-containing protein 1 isoform X2 [Lepisosteus oculatus]|uniref:cyclic nucleotide-binding domain-containing protein 1 isoform X2 n=1 Tax=Lepisosteus oculatus TaxID=7918 RepID=UPI003710CD84
MYLTSNVSRSSSVALRLQKAHPPHFVGIDYTRLQDLCNLKRLCERSNLQSTDEAHDIFMMSYPKLFLQPKKVLPSIPQSDSKLLKTSQKKASQISKRQGQYQMGKKLMDPIRTSSNQAGLVIRVLKKIPIERTQAEHQAVLRLLRGFPGVTGQLSQQELRQLSSLVITESWEKGQTIFGNNGFYVILKGSVKSQTQQDKKQTEEQNTVLGFGCCFGTLEEVQNYESNRVLCFTAQENCEILKISHRDYATIKKENYIFAYQEIASRDQAMKEDLIRQCPFYEQWPKLSISKLATLIEMRNLPASYVLVREGDICPFAAYIRHGECNILQDIGALVKKRFGKMHVVVGKLTEKQSFGEVSILSEQPSTCTIITATEVELGVIQPEALKGLDKVTRSLMLQTAQPTYGKLSQLCCSTFLLHSKDIQDWRRLTRSI